MYRLRASAKVSRELVLNVEQEELRKIREAVGAQAYAGGRFDEASKLFEEVALSPDFTEFLTLPAYERID